MSNPYNRQCPLDSLREAPNNRPRDIFKVGTVITFTVANKYRYAAIKVNNETWFTTGDVGLIPKSMGWRSFADVLQRSHVKDIKVATAFEAI